MKVPRFEVSWNELEMLKKTISSSFQCSCPFHKKCLDWRKNDWTSDFHTCKECVFSRFNPEERAKYIKEKLRTTKGSPS